MRRIIPSIARELRSVAFSPRYVTDGTPEPAESTDPSDVSTTPTRGGVKYERMESTKMNETDLLCPDNEHLLQSLKKYADLQRRRGNVELAHAYTVNANGILDNVRKFVLKIRTTEDAKRLRMRFIPSSARNDFVERVAELSTYGNIAELDEDPAITSRKLFQSVPGLSHMADDFVMKGYRTIQDLLDSKEAETWSQQQLRELTHYEDFRMKVQCQEGLLMSMLLQDHIYEWNRDVRVSETGSVRRRELWGRESAVRLLVTHPDVTDDAGIETFMKELTQYLFTHVNGGSEWEVWHESNGSVLLKARIPPVYSKTKWRKLSLRFVKDAQWVPQVLETTGHDLFVEKLKARMAEKSWDLSPDRILDPNGEVVVFKTEAELFARIEEPFIPPFDRTEQGPQLGRRNNQYSFEGGEYKEKPRAHRVRNHRGPRPTFQELVRRREAGNVNINKDFDFSKTHFEDGFSQRSYHKLLDKETPSPEDSPTG